MSVEKDAWDALSSDYIHRVEQELAQVDHPRKNEVLSDLRSHLAQRFADLPAEERTPERMKAVMDEMEPPGEYAELLSPSARPGSKKRFLARRFCPVAGLALGVLALVYLALSPELWLWALMVIVYGGIAAVLLVQYRRTRDAGFLWLAVPLAVWPLLAIPFTCWHRVLINRLMSGEPVSMYPYSLVAQGEMTLGSLTHALTRWAWLAQSALILLALTRFYRGTQERT